MNKYGVIAIHGGEIEPGTSEIAKNISGNIFPIYVNENGEHVSSDSFENEEIKKFLEQISVVISIHGEKDTEKSFVMIGGLDKDLAKKIEMSLKESGFETVSPPESLDGDNPKNICNRGLSGAGVQIEISRKLRNELMQDENFMEDFCSATRSSLI